MNEDQGNEGSLDKFSDTDLLNALTNRLRNNPSVDSKVLTSLKGLTSELDSREQPLAPTIDEGNFTPVEVTESKQIPETMGKDQALDKFRELLISSSDIEFSLSVKGEIGTQAGQVQFDGGYKIIKSPDYIYYPSEKDPGSSNSYGTAEITDGMIKGVPGEDYEARFHRGAVLFVPNPRDPTSTYVSVKYPMDQRHDTSQRRGWNFIEMIVPNPIAEELETRLHVSDAQSIFSILQDRIDPDLNKSTPIPKLKDVRIARLVNGSADFTFTNTGYGGPRNTETVPQPPKSRI